MSRRLTQARCERWTKDLDKAMSIIAKVEREQHEYLQAAKGGRYHDLLRAHGASKAAKHEAKNAAARNEDLVLGEIRRA